MKSGVQKSGYSTFFLGGGKSFIFTTKGITFLCAVCSLLHFLHYSGSCHAHDMSVCRL